MLGNIKLDSVSNILTIWCRKPKCVSENIYWFKVLGISQFYFKILFPTRKIMNFNFGLKQNIQFYVDLGVDIF